MSRTRQTAAIAGRQPEDRPKTRGTPADTPAEARGSPVSGLAANPLDLLLPYQRRFVLDQARFKIWLAARQVGKSFAVGAEVALDCHLHPGTHWLLVSAGERQALELAGKVRQWLEAFQLVLEGEQVVRDAGGDWQRSELRLRNGSRITALPANPDTVRGYSANLVLDEFAFHRDATAIWRSVLPIITNPLRGQLKVRICSTPNGQGGPGSMFYQLWSGASDQWSRHRTTIHDAAAEGLAVDIEALRTQMADADGWVQEYECQFIDGARSAFPYDVIGACEGPEASETWTAGEGALFAGVDIGALHDPTECVTLRRLPDGRHAVAEVLRLERVVLSDQDDSIAPRLGRAVRSSMDASGLGLDIAQRMVRRFGGKVVAQPTTTAWKRTAFRSLRSALVDRRIVLPASRRLRDDLHAYQVSGAGEAESYWAPRSAEGHSDFASALAHAWAAATAATSEVEPRAWRRPAGTIGARRHRARQHREVYAT